MLLMMDCSTDEHEINIHVRYSFLLVIQTLKTCVVIQPSFNQKFILNFLQIFTENIQFSHIGVLNHFSK